jgi:prolyl-tRNA synthetase
MSKQKNTKSQNAMPITREENFAEWYQEVIKASDLAEHAVVRGCMIIKPWGYALWENIQAVLDKWIKETGHDNVYFPMLIPLSFMQKEAEHVEGFAKECAVVTHYRLEDDGQGNLIPAPDAKLAEPYILRPTSETIIGDAMASWMHSYKDLPIKINQWANIMRWEMRTRLFLRTSEFLWQEGHTAHATAEEAQSEALTMLDVYEKLAVEYLAIPVIKGEKTLGERFPGAVNTYCIEAMMQDGKALQAGTSHFLGQNFSKAHNMLFTNKEQKEELAWTTSWGVSTRLIGALVLTHSDDDGLVLPPRIAPSHVILIPVIMNEADSDKILAYCDALAHDLKQVSYFGNPVKVSIDKKDDRAGVKFWRAVKKGVPLRVEIGLREIEGNNLSVSRRDKPAKEKVSLTREALISSVPVLLDEIHHNLYQRALDMRNAKTVEINTLADLENHFQQDENSCIGWAVGYLDISIEDTPTVTEKLKGMKLTVRCILNNEKDTPSKPCIFSGKAVSTRGIFARAY